jgi:NTP pyrophosphatase (non-canonical NTP hydrolase)
MNFTEYQVLAHQTSIYPESEGIYYTVLGLANEAGEVAGKLKKWIRGDTPAGPSLPEVLEGELGDTLWYLAEICTVLGIDFNTVAYKNVEKLKDRAKRNMIRGSGDTR